MIEENCVQERAIIVMDVGKTLAKLSLWDADGTLIERHTRANARTEDELDARGIEDWLAKTLHIFAGLANVGAIIPVAHGAAAAIIRDGRLLHPPIDYELRIPPALRQSYDILRDPFAHTGSPALPDGLNLGAQLYRIGELPVGAQILLWPQYWAWLLSGVAASEVTSLGSHTDLWLPGMGKPSRVAEMMGWARALPPLRKAGDALGPITPHWAARTGLPADTQIHCGLHDSNAALVAARGFPEIAGREATVLSTGTWFVAMRTPAEPVDLSTLPEGRDCLVNVDVAGTPIPSARWMGGREIEMLIGIETRRIDIRPDQAALIAAVPGVIASGAMLCPTFAAGLGPFPNVEGQWFGAPEDWIARRAAVSLYAALVTNVSLDLIGAKGVILIEGRFAEAEVFVRALASLRPHDAIYVANGDNDVSYGALRLLIPRLQPQSTLQRALPLGVDLSAYAAAWHNRITTQGEAA
jgi:sugar (pentulose or hexulose) kinase